MHLLKETVKKKIRVVGRNPTSSKHSSTNIGCLSSHPALKHLEQHLHRHRSPHLSLYDM